LKRSGQAIGQNERNYSGTGPLVFREDDDFQGVQQVDQLIEQLFGEPGTNRTTASNTSVSQQPPAMQQPPAYQRAPPKLVIKGNKRTICNATIDRSGNATTVINSGAGSEMLIEGNTLEIDGQNGKLEQRNGSTEYKNEGTNGARVEFRGNKELVKIAPGKEFKEHNKKRGFVNESGESVNYIEDELILNNVSGVDHDLDTRIVVKKT
jgi:hypothetical protein